MIWRTILPCLALLPMLVVGTGCSRAKAKPPAPVNFVRPSEAAKKDLFHIAKKIEDPASFQSLEHYIASYEDPAKEWTLYDLDEVIIRGGNFSIQTRTAYDNYRKFRLLESKK